MNTWKLAGAALLLTIAWPIAITTTANAQSYRRHYYERYGHRYDDGDEDRVRVFRHPRVHGLLLDGCYRYPGACGTKREADAFCRLRGYDDAVDWRAENRGGLFKTKRLGDGGSRIASCTVMTFVACQ